MKVRGLISTRSLLLCILIQSSHALPTDDNKSELALRNDTNSPGSNTDGGDTGSPGPQCGGVVYTRWGSSSCADVPWTKLIYSGMAGKAYHYHKGGGVDFQCLPSDPQFYEDFQSGVQGNSPLYGVEYEAPITGTHDHNMPCAVCYASTRNTQLMIPARLDCPATWIKEYSGYLMADHYTNYRSTFACVDRSQESIPGSSDNSNAALVYHVEPMCNLPGFPCPPYDAQKELTCVVCTK